MFHIISHVFSGWNKAKISDQSTKIQSKFIFQIEENKIIQIGTYHICYDLAL